MRVLGFMPLATCGPAARTGEGVDAEAFDALFDGASLCSSVRGALSSSSRYAS